MRLEQLREQRGKEEAEGIRQGAALKKFGRTS
jgi:hypothetical protein